MTAIILNLKPFVELSNDQFYQLCLNHRELKFERTAQGELVVMSPVGGEWGNREADIIADLVYCNKHSQLGKVFRALHNSDMNWGSIWCNVLSAVPIIGVRTARCEANTHHICVDCYRQFIDVYTAPKGYSDQTKARCVKMDVSGMGFRGIERVTGGDHTTVITWVRQVGERRPEA